MRITIGGKTADCFWMVVKPGDGTIKEYDGYPPECLGGGDGIELEIDVTTGQILNWDAANVILEINDLLEQES